MPNARANFSRRDLLTGASLAAGALAARPAGAVAAVSIAKVAGYGGDLVAELQRMFDQLGGLGNLVRGKTVAMKLNLSGAGGGRRTTGRPHWVHPRVVGALAAVFDRLGARRIRLLESTNRPKNGMPLDATLQAEGWDARSVQAAAPRVEFVNTNGPGRGGQYATLNVKTRQPYIFPAFSLNTSYTDCDFFVSVAKLKNHEEMGVTLSMKNLLGVTPGLLYAVRGASRRPVLHYGQAQPAAGAPAEIDAGSNRYEGWRLPRVVVDLCGARPIDLAVIDGIETLIGGEAPGALGARAGKPGLLVAGRNCVSTDAVAMAVMGYNPREGRNERPFRVSKNPRTHPREQLVPAGSTHAWADNPVLLGGAAGLGTAALDHIDVRGVAIRDGLYDFEEPWKGPEKG